GNLGFQLPEIQLQAFDQIIPMLKGFLEMKTRVGEKHGHRRINLGGKMKQDSAFGPERSGHGKIGGKFPHGPADNFLGGLCLEFLVEFWIVVGFHGSLVPERFPVSFSSYGGVVSKTRKAPGSLGTKGFTVDDFLFPWQSQTPVVDFS